ncbi:hypothetical protein L7F22_006479 [Adiantum nelumboides]|nr:hypothetical protein [Adiantum nelumboides]
MPPRPLFNTFNLVRAVGEGGREARGFLPLQNAAAARTCKSCCHLGVITKELPSLQRVTSFSVSRTFEPPAAVHVRRGIDPKTGHRMCESKVTLEQVSRRGRQKRSNNSPFSVQQAASWLQGGCWGALDCCFVKQSHRPTSRVLTGRQQQLLWRILHF